MPLPYPTTQILGISFYSGSLEEAIHLVVHKGGLLVAPAAPALINIPIDPSYRKALEASDLAITDSTLMVALWNLWKKTHLKKISGYRFLKALLEQPELKNNSFWIMPSEEMAKRSEQWLHQIKNYPISVNNTYIAPFYNKNNVEDPKLLNLLQQKKPQFIVNNLGGGTQEKLGLYLKKNLGYKPAIICTGAALAFFTGSQAKIPTWADRSGLGWLFRCINDPKKFIPRYIKAFKLIPLLLKYGKNSPAPDR